MPSNGKVFVSHASADKPFVDRFVADLASRSIPVWYDKLDLRIGESITGAINSGLSEAKYFAIVLSKASVASKWVQEELNAALMTQVAQGGTFILPLLLEDCQVPPLLAHRKHADFRVDYTAALADLLSLWGKDSQACATAHRQTKRTATAMQNLLLPRHIPTLPEAVLPLPTKRHLHPRPDRRKEPRPTAGHKQVAKQFADGK
jgi:hypothetical protein